MNAVFRAIADPTRREILDFLSANNEESVLDITKDFDMSLPAVSQHLKVLRKAGLISGRRVGRQIFYHLNPAPLRDVAHWIGTYEKFWKDRLNALETHLRKRYGPHRT